MGFQSGKSERKQGHARVVNDHLDSIHVKINSIHSKHEEAGASVTAKKIKDLFNGVDEKKKTILEIFNYHNDMVKKQIGKDFASTKSDLSNRLL
ncbi:MAG TPA: hypothetical protein ACFCUD_00235 [Cyclobacteriaceae bacterium]